MNLDALVRDHLEREAGTVDASRLLAGVHARLAADAAPTMPSPRRSDSVWRWRLAVAAAVVLVGLFGVARNPARASPEQLLREAGEVHARSVDRVYRLRVEPAPELAESFPALGRTRAARVWTRGDRYTVDDGRVIWGRTPDGKVWAAPSRDQGLLLDPARLPRPIAAEVERALRVRTLHLETLLRELPRDFQLIDEGRTPSGDRRLRAEPRPSAAPSPLGSVEVEIDPATRVVRRLTLHHRFAGRPMARVTFTLEETRPQPELWYELRGHVKPNAPLIGPDRPLMQLDALRRALR